MLETEKLNYVHKFGVHIYKQEQSLTFAKTTGIFFPWIWNNDLPVSSEKALV